MYSSPSPIALAGRGAMNLATGRPLCVSFEVTYRCNARCMHCHLGAPIPDEVQAPPERFGQLSRQLRPVVAQVSGGEPTIRRDIEQIVSAIKQPGNPPMIVMTTNATRLTRERYDRLVNAGVDEFSVSFDYPDERHDEFRRVPGLFDRITNLLESIRDLDNKRITLAAVVHRQNMGDLVTLAEYARRWNVRMNFSTYTWMRTNDKDNFIPRAEELPRLQAELDRLREHKRRYPTIRTSDFVFEGMVRYFRDGTVPNCKAGRRFMVVNPAGTLSPCGLVIRSFHSTELMDRQFVRTNTCGDCFTSIRANTEKPLRYQVIDGLRSA